MVCKLLILFQCKNNFTMKAKQRRHDLTAGDFLNVFDELFFIVVVVCLFGIFFFLFVYNWPNYSCVLFSVMQDVTTNTERGRRIGQAVASTGKAVGKSVLFLWLLNRSQGSKVLEILQCSILRCSVKRWFRVCWMFLFLSCRKLIRKCFCFALLRLVID